MTRKNKHSDEVGTAVAGKEQSKKVRAERPFGHGKHKIKDSELKSRKHL